MDNHPPPFVGFYWTLPVPRFGFTHLPADVDEAAKVSRTIRYQRDAVRYFAERKRNGQMAGEIVWIEHQPDRGGHYVSDSLDRAIALCRSSAATLLYVDFGERFGWRQHGELRELLKHCPVESEAVYPDPVLIEGQWFDPVEHFREWQRTLHQLRMSNEEKKEHAGNVAGLIAPYLPPETEMPDYRSGAALLNREGIRTTTGKAWTPDSLRMFLNKHRSDGEEIQSVSE